MHSVLCSDLGQEERFEYLLGEGKRGLEVFWFLEDLELSQLLL